MLVIVGSVAYFTSSSKTDVNEHLSFKETMPAMAHEDSMFGHTEPMEMEMPMNHLTETPAEGEETEFYHWWRRCWRRHWTHWHWRCKKCYRYYGHVRCYYY